MRLLAIVRKKEILFFIRHSKEYKYLKLESEIKQFAKRNKERAVVLRVLLKKYDKDVSFNPKKLEKVKAFLRTKPGKPLRLKNIK